MCSRKQNNSIKEETEAGQLGELERGPAKPGHVHGRQLASSQLRRPTAVGASTRA
ncbi:uncharacterized protein BDZ99DRAFT_459928 [Mytilinidion resinicola]|uniref:Uncharacterized protein n=1 Tax=Mytilinidion resinicola TaxID=574789 RepID=A0A6A6Z0J3_9PEZI|nr:uncharacterized protein BDZ99DRAFT_459928 [Mytilinidion resinicola]KAF2814223.1 hypothetical protein BDZ99DRAFT_459928 [Mytilinidion resinicola]